MATENVDSDGRTFTITVTPPDGGKWSGFEIIEIDDISATSSNVSNNVDSTEDFKVVQRETPSSFPIPFPSDSDVVNVSLARFGAVYRVNVKSVSDFNLRSVGVADTFVMTRKFSGGGGVKKIKQCRVIVFLFEKCVPKL